MRLSVVIVLLVLVGCSPRIERKEKPDNLIGKDDMAEVMTELVMLEGHVESKYVQLTRYYKVIDKSGDSLIKAHGFTPKQFSDSYDYYCFQQKELQEIYVKILDNLNREMADIELEEQKKKID